MDPDGSQRRRRSSSVSDLRRSSLYSESAETGRAVASGSFPGLHKILENKWYVDEIYEAVDREVRSCALSEVPLERLRQRGHRPHCPGFRAGFVLSSPGKTSGSSKTVRSKSMRFCSSSASSDQRGVPDLWIGLIRIFLTTVGFPALRLGSGRASDPGPATDGKRNASSRLWTLMRAPW